MDARFKLTILTNKGDTAYFNDFSLENDFTNLEGGNEQTDWFLSKNQIEGLWGYYVIRFDWYDNLGEPGIFGGFSFTVSELDVTPPVWRYISLGTFPPGTNIVVTTDEDATVYMVPEGTLPDIASIMAAAVSEAETTGYKQANLTTNGVNTGNFVLYAVDGSGNISVASSVIKLEFPVNATQLHYDSGLTVTYDRTSQYIKVKSSDNLSRIELYNILGQKVTGKNCARKAYDFQINGLISGIYFIHVLREDGTLTVKKILKN